MVGPETLLLHCADENSLDDSWDSFMLETPSTSVIIIIRIVKTAKIIETIDIVDIVLVVRMDCFVEVR